MLEKMGEFFDRRIDGYDEHMMTEIESASEFYPFTASLLPTENEAQVLDLGCGTGLELEEYFKLNQTAHITGIDLAPGMLKRLRTKLSDKNLSLILGNYFDTPLGYATFDAAVSVESLHHFTKAEKLSLYKRIYDALVDGGYFVLTDYFAESDAEEKRLRKELEELKNADGAADCELYHFDTPLTVAHEIEALMLGGFSKIEHIASWGATHTLKAYKRNSKGVLNITNGDAFNEHFILTHSECALPFREAMMDGDADSDIFSKNFIQKRCIALNVSESEYLDNACAFRILSEHHSAFSKVKLWFGKDAFCQMNLLTLLAYLEKIGFRGEVCLNYVDDESFEILEKDIPVMLGGYRDIYDGVLVAKRRMLVPNSVLQTAIDLYLDYLSENGRLAEAVRNNSDMEWLQLLIHLLKISKDYRLSDLQAEKLIKRFSSKANSKT